jgi:hypothetical protein
LIHPFRVRIAQKRGQTIVPKVLCLSPFLCWADSSQIQKFSFPVPHQKILKQYGCNTSRM